MDVEAAIRARRTHKQYGPQPVSNETLRALLDLARFAPNHKLTQPWRFRVLGPAIRAQIENLAGEKEAAKLRRAPTLVLATAALSGDPHVDEEDLHATACTVYAILLGATARGLTTIESSSARAIGRRRRKTFSISFIGSKVLCGRVGRQKKSPCNSSWALHFRRSA